MPNRMLRDWTNSDKVDSLSFQAEVFFTRLIMKADDYGCFWADTRLLKANLFPLKLDKVREADLSRWMTECQKAGLIVIYDNNQKKYLQIIDFRQRLDKAKAKFPLPSENQTCGDFPEVVNGFRVEAEAKSDVELEQKSKRPNGLVVASDDGNAARQVLKKEYSELVISLKDSDVTTAWTALKTFVQEKKPDWPEPYVDAWNLFAPRYKLAKIEMISDSRRKKFATRIAEQGFDFYRILEKIKLSPHLKGDNNVNWKCSFDWILENDKNYLKILEGNYN